MSKPNILILMTDQQRGDCLSAAGHPVIRTPNMDRLASEGLRFDNAYTTCPVCMPARSSFLSGLYCHNHGQWGNTGHLPEDADTYNHHVKRAGYRTCHIGKSHLYSHENGLHLNERIPFMNALGFDDVLESTGPWSTVHTDSIMTDRWKEAGCLDTFRNDYEDRKKTGPTKAFWPSPLPEEEHADAWVGKTAIEYLEKYDREEPFCVFVGFGGPHEPWDPPPSWAKRYDPADMDPPKPITTPGEWVPEEAAAHQRELQNNQHKITPEINGAIRSLYYAKISHVDWWFGRILETLEKKEVLDDTAIIFWSDHGEMLCDKGRLYKTVFYEESANVPFIVRPPRYDKGGAVCSRLVNQIDAVPTMLDLAGCETESRGFGKSLIPLLEDPEAEHRDAVFSEFGTRTMIRDERYKMVVDNTGEVLKLYDMSEDPEENVNLAGREGTEETIAALRDRMLDWLLETQLTQGRTPY